jgi:hypothetical protein
MTDESADRGGPPPNDRHANRPDVTDAVCWLSRAGPLVLDPVPVLPRLRGGC